MENIRLVDTSLKIVFEEGTSDNETFRREFMSLLMLHDDPLSVWLKSDKIRKESEDTDKILLTLIAELHRKVDILSLLSSGSIFESSNNLSTKRLILTIINLIN